MQIQETHYVDNGYSFTIPAVPHRRLFSIPLLLATAPETKSKASQKLKINGAVVTEAYAEGGIFNNNGALSLFTQTRCSSWIAYIEPNQTITIQTEAWTSDGGQTPKGYTVMIGNA
ncbi:hypothetical protein [Serratia fonticola]|uniref:hypothetical protein n=1 Tax=Serratia fonticola TaxID=47917 RepID=UPI00217B6881|nr:hypothetical protein [Serratia fonticola]CAI1591737.1 Uncharacterised protein [Serratia fonticola]CAI1906875.1 Uncharacterised protein [Serratia fonticola]CAI1925070.1 Uncharacterised protein [Serratia fonticola]